MRSALVLAALAAASIARADTGAPSTWPAWKDAKQGVALKHPPGAKVTAKGGTITIAGADVATVTITIAATDERARDRSGGVSGTHVEYTIAVPRRRATCTADAKDQDQADLASWTCDSIALEPAPRTPHVEATVTSSGLADGDAFERGVRGKQRALDACWAQALRKDKELPEGSITIERTYDHGQPSALAQHASDFFDHDARPLAACVAGVVKGIPAKTAADAATTKVVLVFQYY
jgi:hypothetical protein